MSTESQADLYTTYDSNVFGCRRMSCMHKDLHNGILIYIKRGSYQFDMVFLFDRCLSKCDSFFYSPARCWPTCLDASQHRSSEVH